MSTRESSDLLSYWPAEWPGRQVVELDNLGDPGAWLEEQMPEIEAALEGDAAVVNEAAEALAEEYLRAAKEMGFPVPSDFEGTAEEDRQQVEEEFRGFLTEWRKRIQNSGEDGG